MAEAKPRAIHRSPSAIRLQQHVRIAQALDSQGVPDDGYTFGDTSRLPQQLETQEPLSAPPIEQPDTIARAYHLSPLAAQRALDLSRKVYSKLFDDERKAKLSDIEAAFAGTGSAPDAEFTVYPVRTPTASEETVDPNVRQLEIMHNWTQELQHEEPVAHLNVVDRNPPASSPPGASSRPNGAATPLTGPKKGILRGYIGWIHAREDLPSLPKFEAIFERYIAPGLSSKVKQTSKSLLRRVKNITEKQYTGGRFLLPGLLRYDGRSLRKDEYDQPCTFFCFPYFAMGDFGTTIRKHASIGTSMHTSLETSMHALRRAVPANSASPAASSKNKADDESVHPVRMLLQSRYRLESNTERDGKQSVTNLTADQVQLCIRPLPVTQPPDKNRKWRALIHVPQLWGVSISGDNMITSGPINDADLDSSAINIHFTSLQSSSTTSIVRINVNHQGKPQRFLYPKKDCDWWFGLLSKQRQILAAIGDRKDDSSNFVYKFYNREGARDQDVVTGDNWIDMLRLSQSPELDLWMEPDIPQFQLTPDRHISSQPQLSVQVGASSASSIQDDAKSSQTAGQNSKVPAIPDPPSKLLEIPGPRRHTRRSSASSSIGSNATVIQLTNYVAFLEWPTEDDKEAAMQSSGQRVKVWLTGLLNNLRKTLPGEIESPSAQTSPQMTTTYSIVPQQSHIHVIPGRTRAEIQAVLGRKAGAGNLHDTSQQGSRTSSSSKTTDSNQTTANQTEPSATNSSGGLGASGQPVPLNDTLNPVSNTGISEHIPHIHTIEAICAKSKYLLQLFVPDSLKIHDTQGASEKSEDHPAIRLYWGLLYKIVSSMVEGKVPASATTELLRMLSALIPFAEELHKGVRRYPLDQSITTSTVDETVNAHCAILQKVMVRALECLFLFLFDAVHYVSENEAAPAAQNDKIEQIVGGNFLKARDFLKDAKDYLIADTDEGPQDQSLGPVVTPESIIIILIERLTRGVYKNGSVDIIDIYEKVVERLAVKVESRASRRLLLKINRVSEELDIVREVLEEQRKFLVEYRDLLSPQGFGQPSITRKTRYPFEKRSLDRIIRTMDEKVADCKELLARAEGLTLLNVQLVETQQDDNNKAIMIFTVVTITFLPLSFVTGFFGMNVVGISETTSTVRHFWVIAVPVTVAIMIICSVLAYWNWLQRTFSKWRKNKRD